MDSPSSGSTAPPHGSDSVRRKPPPHRGLAVYADDRPDRCAPLIAETVVHSIGSLDEGGLGWLRRRRSEGVGAPRAVGRRAAPDFHASHRAGREGEPQPLSRPALLCDRRAGRSRSASLASPENRFVGKNGTVIGSAKERVVLPLSKERAYAACMRSAGRDHGAAPLPDDEKSRIIVTIMTPWRVGGVFRIYLRTTSKDETEVTIRGVGFVKRDVERVAAELRSLGSGA